MRTSMTPYERVMERLAGNPVDRIPNLCILMTFAAKYIGVTYDRYVTDFRLLVEGNMRCCEDFGIDMLSAISDPMREAQGFGAAVTIPSDGVPYAASPLIEKPADLTKLTVHAPVSCERMLDRIKAIELYRQKVGDHYPVLGWVEGAFAEACDLCGVSTVMENLIRQPNFILDVLEICTKQAIDFALAQISAGADFIGIGDAAASLIGPRFYSRFALPYEQRIIDAIHQAGGKVKLHICGNITSILELAVQSSTDILDIDWLVDFNKAIAVSNGICAACGNFNPVSVLLQSTTTEVESAVEKCVQASSPTTFIAAGCEVPRDTPLENQKMVSLTLKKLSMGE
jgi:MtaA/CmuA family methyltransferase